MGKNLLALFIVFICAGKSNAKTVPAEVAQTVAFNFYAQNSKSPAGSLALAYTETSLTNGVLYYVFNVSANSPNASPCGFVIVSADDAMQPIIGYSTKGKFVVPQAGSSIYYWMQCRAGHISYLKSQNIQPTAGVASEWNRYINSFNPHRAHRVQTPPFVLPLCQSTWNQSPYYNSMCPGYSVTGCVATAMAQVMYYWSYPAHGIGSSFYTETSPENYGLLSANYDTSNYIWAQMPANVTSPNNYVAELMYDCGVSVDMSYSPSESGAWVIIADNKICAQSSYVNYFGYNARTIQGLKRKNYNDSAWLAMIDKELNNSRVIEYAGWDSVYGGHTWVCDGYDTNNYLHMNWGWGGYDNAYFKLDTLKPGGYFFSKNEEMVIGIEPPPVRAAFNATPINGCEGISVNFTDRSLVSSPVAPVTGWKWTFTGGTPSSSNLQNPVVVYNTPGLYPVTLIVTNANGTDTLTKNTYININGINTLPFAQSFEGAFPPAQWAINNPMAHPATWSQYAGAGGFGNSTHCMYFNNCENGKLGRCDQVYTPAYNFSSVSNPYLYFDVAYAPYNSVYCDTLAVYYSFDCGNTFTRAYLKGGMKLCTTGGQTVFAGANQDMNGCFVPLSNNWRTDTVMIPAIAGQSSVMFSFENRSGNGSNLYIDNINVPQAEGVNQLGITNYELRISPNPNNGRFNILSSITNGQPSVEIYNMLGEKIYTSKISAVNTQMDLTDKPVGVYLYRVTAETGNLMGEGKFIIER